MWGNKGKEKNALKLVRLELVTPGQEARVLTIRPPVPPKALFSPFSLNDAERLVSKLDLTCTSLCPCRSTAGA